MEKVEVDIPGRRLDLIRHGALEDSTGWSPIISVSGKQSSRPDL